MILIQRQKYKPMEQARNPRDDPCACWQFIFDKGSRNIQWSKDSFNKWCWDKWTAACKTMNLDHLLTPQTEVNSKRIKDLNVKPESIRLLEGNISNTCLDINHSDILYDPPPRVMEMKAKLNKWDLIKFKSICTAKETISKVKRQPSEWEKMIANKQLTKD